jgi:hypothetical protein
MNRRLAIVLLILLIVGQLFSIYAFSQGRFNEALFMFPLLIVIYVLFKIGKGSQ